MRYEEIIEDVGPSVPAELLQGVKLTSVDDFMDSLRRIPRENVTKLQGIMNQMNAGLKPPGYIEVYHGTPRKIADKVTTGGFQLTKGQRQGFMGSIHEVDNQGIFLTDSKALANYFGSNRSEYGNDYKMLTCYIDPSKVVPFEKLPRDVVRLGLKIVNDWEGTTVTKLPMRQWWWLLDQPQFVEAIKGHGYTGVKFKETQAVRKEAGDKDAHTYLIFDPASIKIKEKDAITITKFFNWLKANYEPKTP